MSATKNGKRQHKFGELLRFMLKTLPGWPWKLPLTLLLGSVDILILILIPLAGAKIINALIAGSWTDFRRNLINLGLLTFSQLGVSLLHRYVFLCIDERSGNVLRKSIVDRVLSKSLRFFDKHWVGDIVSRITNDSSLLKNFITGILLQIIYDVASLSIVVVVLWRMNRVLAALTIATAPITLLYGRLVKRKLESAMLRVRESVAAVTGHVQSWMSRPFAIKAHLLEREASRRFGIKNDELMGRSVRFGRLGAAIGAINGTLLGIPSLLIFGYGGYIVLDGRLSIGGLFAFMTFSAYFNGPIQRLINIVVVALPTLYPVYDRLQEFLSADDVEQAPSRLQNISPVAGLRADYLTFNFENGDGFNLAVPAFVARQGEIIGIVGANGSGKSTLARLLTGIYDPQSGDITLDLNGHGHAATVNKNDGGAAVARRHLFGVLAQEPTVFDGTLRENITLFDAHPNQASLSALIDELEMTAWVDSLSQGLETEINAGLATQFSDGQIKKIGLGRVLYRNPPIWLLDEPGTSLDRTTKSTCERILSRARAGHIIIIITHSAETLTICDRIYELRQRPGELRTFECVESVGPSLPIDQMGSNSRAGVLESSLVMV